MAIKLRDVSVESAKLNVNCEINENAITAIMGKSGSGKTLLAEVIASLTEYNGSVQYKGKIGVVFQNPDEQFFTNKVSSEIGFSLNYNINSDIGVKIIEALQMVGLNEKYLNRKINSLSSGEKKKVAIASVLADNPKILVLDEPTVGLDAGSRKSMLKILKLLKTKYNKTVIILSKDSDFVHAIADNVMIMYNGTIVKSGNKYDVFTQNIEQYGLSKPKIIQFECMAFENKKVKLLYRDDINDLMKDVYRYVK